MCYFVQLSTHHHLQSAQPLAPFELHYLFSSRLLSLSPSSSLSNSFSLSSTVGFVAGLSCIEAPIYLLFSPLILTYCCSRRPIASRTRPLQEFCSLCPRHESVSQDNDEELRHAGDPDSITSHTSKVFLTYTCNRSILQRLFSLCETLRSPFKVVLNLCGSAVCSNYGLAKSIGQKTFYVCMHRTLVSL